MTKEVLKLALEALQFSGNIWHMDCKKDEAITAIKQALAQAEQEPVAWCVVGDGKFGEYKMGQTFVDYEAGHTYWENRGYELVPVYTNIAKENI
jgi:hypothetical protein